MLKSVGIDIGSTSVKVMEITSTNKGLVLTRFIEHPLSTNPTHDPELDVLEFLRQLSNEYDHSSTVFSVALRQEQVATRYKNFPFRERQKILKSLPFELEEDLPFSSESAVYDAKILQYRGVSAEVLACAAPKEDVLILLKKCTDAFIDPANISSEGAACATWKEKWSEPPSSIEGTALLEAPILSKSVVVQLHLGHMHTVVNILEEGRLISSRSILWGGKHIADAISKRYEISFESALKELQLKGFILTNKNNATHDQNVFSDTIANSFQDLLRELRLYLLEVKSDFNAYVQSVELTGGVSRIQNLGAFLTRYLEAPVNRGNPLALFSQVGFDRTPHVEAASSVALGLAIEGLRKPRNPALNFLRGELAKQSHAFKSFWNQYGFVAQLGIAAIIVMMIWGSFRESASLYLSEASTDSLKTQAVKIAKLNRREANEAGVKKYIKETKKQVAEIKLVSGLVGMNSALDVLKKVNDAVPPNNQVTLQVKKLQIDGADVVVEGTLASNNELKLLQDRLGFVARDGKVTSRAPTIPNEAGKVGFAFGFQVDRNVKAVK